MVKCLGSEWVRVGTWGMSLLGADHERARLPRGSYFARTSRKIVVGWFECLHFVCHDLRFVVVYPRYPKQRVEDIATVNLRGNKVLSLRAHYTCL